MKKCIEFLLIIIFIGLNLIPYSNSLPLKHEEPRRAIIAEEMLLTGNFIVPTVCQVPYYKKPPFHNWLIALTGIKNKYISNFGARVISLLSLILLSFFVFWLVKEIDITKAFWAGIISLTSFSTMISYGMKAEPDMLFTFLFFVSYYFFIKDRIFLSSIFMGASILTKGISPIFFYPSFIITSFFINNKPKFYKKLLFHFLLSLILPAIWIILYCFYGSIHNLIDYLFFQLKDRTVSNLITILKDASLFPFRAFMAVFPWSLLFILSFNKKNFYFLKRNKIFISSLIIFLLIFSILFIFPCGKGRYFLPAVPFFGIITSCLAEFNIEISNYLKKSLSLFFVGISFFLSLFLIIKGYFFQGLFLFLGGIIFFFVSNKIVYFEYLFLCISFFILFISTYFFNFYRSKYMYNYHKAAKLIVKKIKPYNLPIVIDNTYSKLRLLFNIEREMKKPVYLMEKTKFLKYILLTTKKIKNKKPILIKKVKNKIIYFYLISL